MNEPTPELTQFQQALFEHYVELLGPSAGMRSVVRSERTVHFVGFPSSVRRDLVAKIAISVLDGSPLELFASLGDSRAEGGLSLNHEHEFVCICDANDSAGVDLVAHARAHHAIAGKLDAEHTFMLAPTSSLGHRGFSSAIVTTLDLYPPLAGKTMAHVGGLPVRILGLLPLTESERLLKIEHGVQRLFERLRADDRDLLSIR